MTTAPPPLSTTTVGQGPPIVTLHASGLDGRQFARFAREASARFTVMSPDLPGAGGTPLPSPSFSLADEVDAVIALLASSSRGPALLLGHSWGGLVAFEVALKAPQLVRGLCLYEPVIVILAGRDGSDAAKAQVARIDTLMQLPVDDGGRAWVEHFIDWWNGPGFFAAMSSSARTPWVDAALQSHRHVRCGGRTTLTVERLGGLRVPTLFMLGETSPVAARESVGIAARAMPQARLEVVGGAGHMGPLTHGAVVNAAALAFFDGLSRPG